MTLEEAINKTKEHLNTVANDSEEYEILQILLTAAEIAQQTISKLS